VAHVTLDFFDRYLKDDPGALDRLRRDAAAPDVASLQEQVQAGSPVAKPGGGR
jgi:hypothetical protein